MIFPVVWLPEADAELKEALLRYENIRPELAQRFGEAVVDTVEAIAGLLFVMQSWRKDGGGPECAASRTGYFSWWKKSGFW